MSRITKEAASIIAKKQLAPKFEAIEERKKELEIECAKIRIERLPKEMRKVWDKYKNDSVGYFNTYKTKLCNESGHYVWISGEARVIGIANVVNNELFEQYKTIEADSKKLNQTRELLEDTIYNLRTYAKVAEHFPELVQHFTDVNKPKQELVNFTELRNLIKHP